MLFSRLNTHQIDRCKKNLNSLQLISNQGQHWATSSRLIGSFANLIPCCPLCPPASGQLSRSYSLSLCPWPLTLSSKLVCGFWFCCWQQHDLQRLQRKLLPPFVWILRDSQKHRWVFGFIPKCGRYYEQVNKVEEHVFIFLCHKKKPC